MSDNTSKRIDDGLMRNMIWGLIILVLSSAAAILVMQVQISNNTESVKILSKINISIQTLIDSGNYRNDLLTALTKKTENVETRLMKVYGEQQKRGPRLDHLEEEVKILRGRKK